MSPDKKPRATGFKNVLVGNAARRVAVTKRESQERLQEKTQAIESGSASQQITVIPPVTDPNLEEIEFRPIREPYSFVRIFLDNAKNTFYYEVIEPTLTKKEKELLEDLRESIKTSMEYNAEVEDHKAKEEYIRKTIDALLLARGYDVSELSKERVVYYLLRDFVGWGKLEMLMQDPQIEDISCDGTRIPLYIFHRKHQAMPSNIRFETDTELDSFVIQTAVRCGKHISVASPLLDATMPDGSRLQATLAREVTTRGSSFTIRRFRDNPFTPVDLIKFKTMTTEVMAYLWLAIEHGESMFVVGGTASGKTTTINAILLFIPPQMKIVSIEDTREINIPHENWIAGLTREAIGGSDIDMFELMKAAMRQRPNYMIVGEVRGKEAYTLFQAMATGKTVYSTIHADSVRSMVHRLENPPISLPRLLLSSLNLVYLQAQVKVGKSASRRMKALVEIVGIEPETNELITNTVFSWNPANDLFVFSGHSFLFEKIKSAKNFNSDQMREEYLRRIDILNYMVKSGIDNHRRVAAMINAYYRSPESLMREVYLKLYNQDTRPTDIEDTIPIQGGESEY